MTGGALGVVIDARGRPLQLPSDSVRRRDLLAGVVGVALLVTVRPAQARPSLDAAVSNFVGADRRGVEDGAHP